MPLDTSLLGYPRISQGRATPTKEAPQKDRGNFDSKIQDSKVLHVWPQETFTAWSPSPQNVGTFDKNVKVWTLNNRGQRRLEVEEDRHEVRVLAITGYNWL